MTKKYKGAVIDGHEQICKVHQWCFYGGNNGCSYAQETGHSRRSQGIIIVDGVCDAFTPKNGRRYARKNPVTYVRNKKRLFLEV